MQGVLSSVSITVQQEEEVVVYGVPYLERLNDVLSKYDRRSDFCTDLNGAVGYILCGNP